MDPIEARIQKLEQQIRNQRQQNQRLRDRMDQLERLWASQLQDPQLRWLYQNRSERMDPNVPIFDPGRAEFHLDRYRFAGQYVTGKQVLDAACGTGYGSAELIQCGSARRVTGVDACPEAIEYARSIYGGTGIEYVCADACAMPFEDSSFDLAVSFETIEHIENDAGLVAELARVVRPGGTLICSTPNRWPLSIAPHHVREYDRSSFESVLGTHFQILEMWSQNSGSAFEFNHGQAKSIQPTTPGNELTAECFIAVCQRH